MADFDKYDPRVDSLVIETKTLWDPALGTIAPEDRTWLAAAVHAAPKEAAKIRYERAHTGFTREITVTVDDVERIYRRRTG